MPMPPVPPCESEEGLLISHFSPRLHIPVSSQTYFLLSFPSSLPFPPSLHFPHSFPLLFPLFSFFLPSFSSFFPSFLPFYFSSCLSSLFSSLSLSSLQIALVNTANH